jgi:hypothetical protein
MERRVNKRIEDYIIGLKNDVAKKLQEIVNSLQVTDASTRDELMRAVDNTKLQCNSMAGFVYNYEKLRLGKDDFMKRKRIKSVVPIYER